ncbi:juvenile hormone acid O-methyltransferase [Leptinotarsa decemlineata]|uniref:juvenile hormone acid O-methyltransferase n=1 Tax=Leptinotarsa decemlineata TaxID=7539 RepID=UPI003D30D3A7
MNQPDIYSRNNTGQMTVTSQLLDRYLDPKTWIDGEAILEIGTGDGQYTVEKFLPQLPDNIRRYVASDTSEEMIDFAKKKYSEKYPKIEFIVLNCQTDDIPTGLIGQFDHVVSFNVFHWFTNARKAIKNIFSMLKPGGELIATFCIVHPLHDIYTNLSKHHKWGVYCHQICDSRIALSNHPLQMWETIFTEAGFVNEVKFCDLEINWHCTDFEGFFQALDSVYSKIPDKDKKAYLNDYFEEVERGKAFTITRDEKTGKREGIFRSDIVFVQTSKPSERVL